MKLGRILPMVLLVGTAASAHAQTPTALSRGRTSIAFDFPDGGSSGIGIWKMISDRTNLGLNVGFGVGSDDDDLASTTRLFLTAGPAFKRYFLSGNRVAPFLAGSAFVSYNRIELDTEFSDDETHDSLALGASGGIGVDWFPVDQVSLGGQTGLRASYSRPEDDRNSWQAGTFTSSLTLHIYF